MILQEGEKADQVTHGKDFGRSLTFFLLSFLQDGEKADQVTHGKDFGRSLSVENINTLLPLFLAQVLHFGRARDHDDHDDDHDGDHDDDHVPTLI